MAENTSILADKGANAVAENILVMRKVIASARKKFFFVQFGSPDSIPAREGKTVKWFTTGEMTVYTGDLAETGTERKDNFTITPITAALTLKGNDTTWTEFLDITSVVDIPSITRTEIAYNAGKTLDTIVRDVLLADEATSGITHYFANGKTSGSSSGMATTDVANYTDIVKLGTQLEENDVPTFTHPATGEDVYIAIITSRQKEALMLDSVFRGLITNGEQKKAWQGELGVINKICFVVSTNQTQYTYNSLKCDKALVFGRDLYGVPAMPPGVVSGQSANANMDYGSNPEDNKYWTLDKINQMFSIVITKPGDGNGGGTAGDVYAVKSTLAWKAYFVTKILVAARARVYVTYYGA